MCIPHHTSSVEAAPIRCTIIVSIGQAVEKQLGDVMKGRWKGRGILLYFLPQLNCLSNPSQQVTQFICLKSIRSSRCESLSQHKTGPLIILFQALSPGSSRLSLIFSYFQSIIIFYLACIPHQRQMCVFTSGF